MMNVEDEIIYPSIVFEIAGNLFSVDSKYIDGIVQLNEYTHSTDASPNSRGYMKYRGRSIALFDLRQALNMGSLSTQYEEFCQMIDARKEDHIRWVQALENTARENAPFLLATDSHKCALGKWRDAFQSDVQEINFTLRQMDAPHASLHHAALEILKLWEEGDTPENRRAIMAIYDHVKDTYMPMVLSMLEEMKQLFHTYIFREMVLLLKNRENFGVIVEQVHSVEHLTDVCGVNIIQYFVDYSYITSVKRREKQDGLILELDLDKLLSECVDTNLPPL